MRDVADSNHLRYDKDVKMISAGKAGSFYNYLKNNPNMTWYTVVWCTTEWEITEDISIPCQYADKSKDMIFYSIFYNFSLADNGFMKSVQYPAPTDPRMLHIKTSVDNGILKHLASKDESYCDDIPKIDTTWSTYPMPPDRFVADSNLVSEFGSYFFVLGPLLTFSILLSEIAREKELKLR